MELVGREREYAELTRIVSQTLGGVVVVTGAPGVGKSALLTTALRDGADDPSAIWWIDLRSSTAAEDTLIEAIARCLGVWPAVGDASARDVLSASVASNRTIIVVDHAEDFELDDAELRSFVEHAHRTTVVLATNRVPEVRSSTTLLLTSLEVPNAEATLAEVRASPSVRLFLRAAERVGVIPDDEGVFAVGEICDLVGGLPLAIELAAARTRLLSLTALARELGAEPDHPVDLELLRSSQGSMRATLHATIATLEPDQVDLLERLSAFHGRFPLDAAVTVSGRPLAAVLDDLERLVDLRLVDPRAGFSEPELGLLPIVRAYVRERAADHGEDARRRYLQALAAEGASARAELRASEAIERLRVLRRDVDIELRTLMREDPVAAVELAVSAAPVLEASEIGATIGEVLDAALRSRPALPLTRALRAAALLWSSRMIALAPDAQDSVELVTQRWQQGAALADDTILSLQAWMIAVHNGTTTGDLRFSVTASIEGRAMAAAADLPAWTARFEMWAAGALHHTDGPAAAIEIGLRALERAQRTGDLSSIAWGIMLLNTLPLDQVPDHPPVPRLEEGFAIARRLSDAVLESFMYAALTMREQRAGHLASAAHWCALRLELGIRRGWSALSGISFVHTVLIASRVTDDDAAAVTARLIGVVRIDLERILRSMAPSTRPLFDEACRRTRNMLQPHRFAQHVAEGGLLSAADASAVAIAWLRRHSAETPAPPPRTSPITPRELDVLALLSHGLTNKEIADRLHLSAKTVMHHSVAIYRKLGVRGRAEAVAYAFRHGLVAAGAD
ncbi:hypothetical protein GCM10009775_23400 [Microbacterium aoyamense]|uniref:HTH luxR-type domain-containing protein n=1 Tax=Microbacterium aoyamense TaxID=344166 RepID=A0ABN2PS54_9MICO|nr:LuxR C-terminal-related transcriptional regulator [Microbacterium aoyamense]